jgi:membrane protein implicated in regulation of membrane protease activity
VHLWVVWIIAAAILGVAEVLTVSFGMILVAAGALAAALASALGAGIGIQLAAFVVVSLAGIVVIRPIAMRRLRRRPGLRTGSAALVGKTGYVLAEITPYAGLVKIAGEEWSARPYDDQSVIPAGSTVDILQIQGATALVHPRE